MSQRAPQKQPEDRGGVSAEGAGLKVRPSVYEPPPWLSKQGCDEWEEPGEINSCDKLCGRQRYGISLQTAPGETAAKGWPRPTSAPKHNKLKNLLSWSSLCPLIVNHVQSICSPLCLIIQPIMCCFGNIKIDSSAIYELHKPLSGARVKGSNTAVATATTKRKIFLSALRLLLV